MDAVDQSYLDRRIFDPGDLIEQILAGLRPALRKNNVALDVGCQSGLAMNSYPGPYGQVMTNLFLNALAHAFPDRKGGRIDIVVRASGNDDSEIVRARRSSSSRRAWRRTETSGQERQQPAESGLHSHSPDKLP
jgi:signal transduction histidine kinase